jgi:hypothetical protein
VIYLVCTREDRGTIGRFIRGIPGMGATIRLVPYDSLFTWSRAPIGHYVFTCHDLLSQSSLEWTAAFAQAASEADPAARILNHPLQVLERYGLARRLAQLGLGGFEMVRLDEGRLPRFPAFIRCESGTGRPDTGLLFNEADFARALDQLAAAGKSVKGRVAVEHVDVRSPDGCYRKFGAVRIGARIVPQHLFVADDWCVKMQDARFDEATAAEELAFIRGNPPVAHLMEVFDAARIEYGRVDYAYAAGRPVIFEINTNPSLPRPGGGDLRTVRRQEVCDQLAAAWRALDQPTRTGTFRIPPAIRRPARAIAFASWLRKAASHNRVADAYFRWKRNRRHAPVLPNRGGVTRAGKSADRLL